MAKYYITEEARYEVEADSPQEAYGLFINSVGGPDAPTVEVNERWMTDENGDPVVDYGRDD